MLKIPCKVWNSKKFPANFVTKLWRIYMPNSKLYGQHHKFYLKIRWVILGLNMGILEKWKKAARYGYKHPSCQILNPSQCSVMAKHWQTKVYACMILFRLPHCNWKKNHWSWNSFPKTQRLFFLKMLMYPVCVPTQELHQRSNLQLSQSTPIIEVFALKIVG